MAFQQIRLDDRGTFGAYDPDSRQAIAFPDIGSFQKYFAGQNPDSAAPLASFDTTPLLSRANQLVALDQNASLPRGVGELIGGRRSQVDPSQIEYFNKGNNQGFARPEDLFGFLGQSGYGIKDFDTLKRFLPDNALGLDQTTTTDETDTPGFGDQVRSLLTEYGITPPDPTKNPVTEFATMYKDLITQLGVSDLKTKYDELAEKQATEIAEINDNPWLDENTRLRKIKFIEDKFGTKLRLYESLYNNAKSDAQFVAQQALSQGRSDQSLNKEILFKVIDQVEKQSTSSQTPEIKEYLLAVEQGFKGSFLDYKKKAKSSEAGITYSIQDVGGRTMRFGFDANGDVVSKVDLGSSSNKTTPGPDGTGTQTDATAIKTRLEKTKGTDGFVNWDTYLKEKAQSTLGPDEFNKHFDYLLSPQGQNALGTRKSGSSNSLGYDDV